MVLRCAVLKYSDLFENVFYVCLLAFLRACMKPFGPGLSYVQALLVSEQETETYKPGEVTVAIGSLCQVGRLGFVWSSWVLDYHVRSLWKKISERRRTKTGCASWQHGMW